jgi:hypothetical protein
VGELISHPGICKMESFESIKYQVTDKDEMRVNDIVRKSEGNIEKEKTLARVMSDKIGRLDKAIARFFVAKQIGKKHIAEIFLAKAEVLDTLGMYEKDYQKAKIDLIKGVIMNNKEIEDFFCRGHFNVTTPDGNKDDYDNAIPDYYAKLNSYGECIESNGSEPEFISYNNGIITVEFFVHEREYEKGMRWEEKCFITKGHIDNNTYVVDNFEEKEIK